MPALLLGFLGQAGKILTIGITIPIWLMLVVGGWLYFDRNSAIRQAVDQAVTQLVDGAELEAARARAEALELVNAELKGRAEALEGANQRFSESLRQAQLDLENANDQITELASRPVNSDCAVDGSVFERLHSQ